MLNHDRFHEVPKVDSGQLLPSEIHKEHSLKQTVHGLVTKKIGFEGSNFPQNISDKQRAADMKNEMPKVDSGQLLSSEIHDSSFTQPNRIIHSDCLKHVSEDAIILSSLFSDCGGQATMRKSKMIEVVFESILLQFFWFQDFFYMAICLWNFQQQCVPDELKKYKEDSLKQTVPDLKKVGFEGSNFLQHISDKHISDKEKDSISITSATTTHKVMVNGYENWKEKSIHDGTVYDGISVSSVLL